VAEAKVRFPYNEDDADDRKLLQMFFKFLREGFREVIFEGRWGERRISFFGEGQPYLAGAMSETEVHFDRALTAIDETPPQVFADFGLWGRSLRAKLYYIRFWADRSRVGRPSAIRRTLANINIVLGSFFAATGIGEPIKELKDLIKSNIRALGSP
jgi:hypothetical protein